MTIKFLNLVEQYQDNKEIIDNSIQNVFATGQFYNNRYVDELKLSISERYNGANLELCNSGSSALHAALIALNLPKSSNIIVPSLTYCATAQAVVAAGHKPLFVDIDKHWLMDQNHVVYQLEKHEYVEAIIAVDLYGQGVDLDWLFDLKIKVIIDAAQSFGLCTAEYDQTLADAITLSFNPLKNLGGVGGGAVISNKIHPDRLSAACHSGKIKNKVFYDGMNLRMDALQAATVLSKLPYYDANVERKKSISKKYYEAFNKHRDKLDMHVRTPWSDCQYYVFTIAPHDSDKVRAALTANGIEYRSHYDKPLHQEIAFSRYIEYCPYAGSLTGRIISLPNHWHLTDEQVDRVIQTVISAL